MSFTWFADRPLRSREQVMEVIVRVADDLAMPDRKGACIIAGMTVAVEGGDDETNDDIPEFWCPANPADPETLKYQHDSTSNDSLSSGYFQQQPPWWGTAAQRMDLYESCKLFMTSLKRYPYRATNAQEAGSWAQRVQGSSHPERYAKWWQLANDVYNNVKGVPAPPPTQPPSRQPYGMPTGSNSGGYGNNGVRFPDWVYALGNAFNCKPSTYPGHQESDRNEAGYAPNPQHLNRGIDWAGPVPDMQRLADYLFSIRGELEQLIWENPQTNRRLGVAGGKDVTTTKYYDYDGGYNDHRDHVHTRQDHSLPLPGGTPSTPPPPPRQVGWKGDPVWLPDVLRAAGLVCNIYPGAFERGHGDMGQIWGVMAHHTGSFGETPHGIAEHPTLGLASQLYLSRNGEYTLCGVGKAWHGGAGSYPGISDVNGQLIGIEAANDGGGTPGKPHRASWSDAQYDAYTRGVAAILGKLGYGADRVIGHKEWAGKSQGKWDPGAIDMNIFRADVAARLNSSSIPTQPGDDMALVPQDQWDRVFRELTQKHPSRSALRHLGEGDVDTWAGMTLNSDGNQHVQTVTMLARLGHPESLAVLKEVAGADLSKYPDRASDKELATNILADIYSKPAPLTEPVGPFAPAAPQYTSVSPSASDIATQVAAMLPAPDNSALLEENARLREENARLKAVPAVAGSTVVKSPGEITGSVVDSVTDYTKNLLNMDAAERQGHLAALKALQPSNGDQA